MMITGQIATRQIKITNSIVAIEFVSISDGWELIVYTRVDSISRYVTPVVLVLPASHTWTPMVYRWVNDSTE